MKRFYQAIFIICVIISILTTHGCTNTEISNMPNSQPKTLIALGKYNNDILSQKGVSRSFILNPTSPLPFIPDPSQSEKKKEQFIKIALADLAGAKTGLDFSKYVPFTGPSSTLVIKGSVTLIFAALYSADAYGDSLQENDNSDKPKKSFNITDLNNSTDLLAMNNSLQESIVEQETQKLSDKIELPDTYAPLMEIGARHNLLIEKIITNDIEHLEDAIINLEESEYQFYSSEEFTNIYQEQVDFLANHTITTTNLYCPADDTTLVDDVFNLFIEAFTEYPDEINDVYSLINTYISNIEQYNELNNDEKQIVYTSLCVALASAEYWNDYYDE